MRAPSESILAVDVGGTNVKVLLHGESVPRKISSGAGFTAQRLIRALPALTRGWRYDRVAMGYPGVVWHNRPLSEPHNLAHGWVGVDFRRAFGCPVRILNDAAMQAIGSYEGGRMLFLGLGTGLGSALIIDRVLEAMEIGHLIYRKGRTYEDYLGKQGLQRRGRKKWERAVFDVVQSLSSAFEVNYVVLGGGNAKKLRELPPNARLGSNANAFEGAFRLWLEPDWIRSPVGEGFARVKALTTRRK